MRTGDQRLLELARHTLLDEPPDPQRDLGHVRGRNGRLHGFIGVRWEDCKD